MTLRNTMARHARTVLTRMDQHGEIVTYRFKSGANDRAVRAVVDRLDIEAAQPGLTQGVARQRATVAIPRSAEVGITSVSPGDRIVLAMRLGDEAVSARVKRIVSQDEGMFVLEVDA